MLSKEKPYICTLKKADPVAQLVEQYTFNVWALGSNPSGITEKDVFGHPFSFNPLTINTIRFKKGICKYMFVGPLLVPFNHL